MALGPLKVEVRRGHRVESEHLVDAVVLDADGKIVEAYGESERMVFPRSAVKLIQAHPLAEFQSTLSARQISFACSSHRGESGHIELADQWLKSLNLSVQALECGAHPPADRRAELKLIKSGLNPDARHNNCSGKHCGFLHLAQCLGVSGAGYSEYQHPIQKKLRSVMSEASGFDFDKADWGIDGCQIPTYLMPLNALASMMRIFLDAKSPDAATKFILSSIRKEPFYLGGTSSLSSRVVEVTEGRVIAKTGAEGVFVFVVPEQGLVGALKVRDGATRASEAVLVELLSHLQVVDLREQDLLRQFVPFELKNWSGSDVGDLRVSGLFTLIL